MESHTRYLRIRAVAAAGLAALALVLAPPAAHADGSRTGSEPWYQQTPAETRQRAQALFAQAVDKNLQLLRGDAMELYEQALALWDNPDIRWNLALVLEDLGQYLRAHEQLDGALPWGAALGVERLRDVHDHMRALETQRLARIEAHSTEPGADIKLDGQPWFRGVGRQSRLVLPGEHYIAASKPGYFPVTRSVYVIAGHQARVTLPMDADRLIETRRWTGWKPWAVVAGGIAVAAVGAGVEWRAFADRNAAAAMLTSHCPALTCDSTPLNIYNRVDTEKRFAIAAFATAGMVAVVGLTLAWLNQPRTHRAEAQAPSPIELAPILSPDRVGVSTLIRF